MKDETLAETDPPDLGKYVKSFSPLIFMEEKNVNNYWFINHPNFKLVISVDSCPESLLIMV